jgi:hypothetical protein
VFRQSVGFTISFFQYQLAFDSLHAVLPHTDAFERGGNLEFDLHLGFKIQRKALFGSGYFATAKYRDLH